jgi:hypothetical protein
MRPGCVSYWSVGCCGAASCPRRRSGSCAISPATASGRFQAHSAECQRIQKTLRDAGIKLDSVAADILGVSGRAMLTALVAGERDPKVLAELAKGRLRAKLPQLRQALRGRFGEHQRTGGEPSSQLACHRQPMSRSLGPPVVLDTKTSQAEPSKL